MQNLVDRRCSRPSINTVLAAGMTFVILTGGIDLSVGSILAASAMAGADRSSKIARAGACWAAGRPADGPRLRPCQRRADRLLRLPPFIVTLGSLTAVRGLARLLGGDTTLFNPQLPFAFIGNGYARARRVPGSS